jgi:hypothetical protein
VVYRWLEFSGRTPLVPGNLPYPLQSYFRLGEANGRAVSIALLCPANLFSGTAKPPKNAKNIGQIRFSK